MDEEKLTHMATDVQKLISKVWEQQSQITELQAALTEIRDMLERRGERRP